MRAIIHLTLLTIVLASSTITAQLKIVQYDPMVMELVFSEPISKPTFQLLFNNFQNIPYYHLNDAETSQNYYLQITPYNRPTSNLQVYTLVFNNPFDVGDNRLDLSCYSIQASKTAIRTDISKGYTIAILILGYFLSNFTLLGNIILEYSQLYVLLMFHSQMSTTLYQDLSVGLLIIPPIDTLKTYPNCTKYAFECLVIPLAIIYFFGALGYIMKRCFKGEKSVGMNIVFEIFTYNTFLNVFIIFSINLLYNGIQFISIATSSQLLLTSTEKIAGYVLVYFSFLTLASITYLQIYILNPKMHETPQRWQRYLEKSEFRFFSKLHEGINTTVWYTRNSALFILLKKLLIVSVFFTVIFEYLLIYLQFASLYYLFTVRPYKEEVYMNIYFISRLLAFIVYGIIALGDIYFSLGEEIFNYGMAKYVLTIRDIVFLVIILVILGVVVRQVYQKINNLNYRFRLVREENQFKLQILEKNATSGNYEVKKNQDASMIKSQSHASSISNTKRQSEINFFKKMRGIDSSNQQTLKISHTLKKRKSRANFQQDEDYKQYISPKNKGEQSQKPLKSDNVKKIWKEESLLQEMMKMK